MDEWYFNEKEIREIILNKQGNYTPNFRSIFSIILFNIIMLIYGVYSLNILIIYIQFLMMFTVWYFLVFFSDLLENVPKLKKIKRKIMELILFFLISVLMNATIIFLSIIKNHIKTFNLNGVSYSPENILLLFQILFWWTTFIVSMFTPIDTEIAPLFLLITYAICKVFQELTILFSFSNQSKYVKWIFKQDMHKIEMFFIQLLVLIKSLLIVFSFVNIDMDNLSNSLISIVLINGIYNILNYIKNNFSYNPNKEYLLNVIQNLECILSKLEQYKSDDIKIKIMIKPYYLYCNNTKNKKINNALESINNLCFTEEVGRSKKIYENKELLKKEILNTLDLICKTNP